MVYKAQEGWRTFQSRLCFVLRNGQPECLTLWFLTRLNGATGVSVTCTEVTGLCLIQLALERQSVIFISILASLALKTSGTSTAMHLVSIIYLFISASRFGPGCCLNWCLTKWQPFLLRAGAASASVSASWVQLPVPAVVPNSLLHGHSERIRCTLKSQLTAGLETSILGTWFSGGLSSVRMMVGWDDLKGLFWPKWLYELWCYPRAWRESSFFPLCVSSVVGQAGAARQLCVWYTWPQRLCWHFAFGRARTLQCPTLNAQIPCHLQHLITCRSTWTHARRNMPQEKRNEEESHKPSQHAGFGDIWRFNIR